MITVTHKIDGNGRKFVTVTNPDYRTYGFETAAYADGTRKPNYPLPAIPHEWFFCPATNQAWVEEENRVVEYLQGTELQVIKL